MGRNRRNIGDFRRYLSHWICFSFSGHHCSLKAECDTSPQPSPQTLPLLSVGNTPHPLYHPLWSTQLPAFSYTYLALYRMFEIEDDTRRRLKTSVVIWISVPHCTGWLITWSLVGGTVCGEVYVVQPCTAGRSLSVGSLESLKSCHFQFTLLRAYGKVLMFSAYWSCCHVSSTDGGRALKLYAQMNSSFFKLPGLLQQQKRN